MTYRTEQELICTGSYKVTCRNFFTLYRKIGGEWRLAGFRTGADIGDVFNGGYTQQEIEAGLKRVFGIGRADRRKVMGAEQEKMKILGV